MDRKPHGFLSIINQGQYSKEKTTLKHKILKTFTALFFAATLSNNTFTHGKGGDGKRFSAGESNPGVSNSINPKNEKLGIIVCWNGCRDLFHNNFQREEK
jgi:hypothetical protein